MLEIKQLQTPKLSDVNFAVEAGHCLCIHGESGSGKTLLLRAIADLDENQGDVTLNHLSRNNMPANHWRERVTFLPAESHWWHDRVGDHFISNDTDFSALDLPHEILNWQVGRLSTGERQRLSLLRALDHKPDFLLMDETTANLDETNTARVEQLIRQKLDTGLGVIWVSHSKSQRQRMADHSLLIQNGQLS